MKTLPSDDPMDPRIQSALDALRPVPPRDPQAAERGRANFLSEAKSLQPAVSPAPKQRLKEWITNLRRKEHTTMFPTLMTFVLTLTLLFGGAGATAYAAQDSLPNDFLYPVKTFTEDLRLEVATSTQAQVELLDTFTQRRFDEMQTLVANGDPIPAETAARLQEEMTQMLQLTAQMEGAAMQLALQQVHTALQTRQQVMEALQPQVPEQAKAVLNRVQIMLQAQRQLVETGLQDPQLFRVRVMQPGNWHAEPPETTPQQGQEGPHPSHTPMPIPSETPMQNGDGPSSPTSMPGDPGQGAGHDMKTPQATCTTTPSTADNMGDSTGSPQGGNGQNGGDDNPQPTCTNTPQAGDGNGASNPTTTPPAENSNNGMDTPQPSNTPHMGDGNGHP